MIGIMHLIYGGFNTLIMLIMIPFMLLIFGTISHDPKTPPEMQAFFGFLSFNRHRDRVPAAETERGDSASRWRLKDKKPKNACISGGVFGRG